MLGVVAATESFTMQDLVAQVVSTTFNGKFNQLRTDHVPNEEHR